MNTSALIEKGIELTDKLTQANEKKQTTTSKDRFNARNN